MGVLRESNLGFSEKSELIDCFENSLKWRSLGKTNFCFKFWLFYSCWKDMLVLQEQNIFEKRKFSFKSGFKHSRWAVGIASLRICRCYKNGIYLGQLCFGGKTTTWVEICLSPKIIWIKSLCFTIRDYIHEIDTFIY